MDKLSWFENVEHRTHPWPGLNWLTSALAVPDVRKAVDFYTSAMGMVAISELEVENNECLFARVRFRGINFTLNKEGWDSECKSPLTSGHSSPFIIYLYIDNVPHTVECMIAGGAEIMVEAKEQFWGDLKARVKDPFGYIWDIAQKI